MQAGVDNFETLDHDQFLEIISRPSFTEFLQVRGIDIKEATTFFNMVAESIGDQELEMGSVVRCCLGIRGYATSIDLHILRYEMREAMEMMDDVWQWLCPYRPPSSRRSSSIADSCD